MKVRTPHNGGRIPQTQKKSSSTPQNYLNSDTFAAAQAFYVLCRQLGFVNGTVWEKISFDGLTRF
jgi:hypothetical protein